MAKTFSKIARKNKRNISMYCAGSTMGAARYPFYRSLNGTKKMLPRPFRTSLPNNTADLHLKKPEIYDIFQDIEDLALHFIYYIIPNGPQKKQLIQGIHDSKKLVPRELRICDTFFTQMSMIGDMTFEEGSQDITPHIDKDDLFTAIVHLGKPISGGELLIYSGTSSKNIGNLLKRNKFVNGNIHMGSFTNVVHAVSSWKGIRGAFSLNLKSPIVEFFKDDLKHSLYTSYARMGFPSDNLFMVN